MAFEILCCESVAMSLRKKNKDMMMLQAFTWQEFLIAALVLSVLWYAGVGLLFYRSEISGFLSGRGRTAEPLAHGWADQVDELEVDLMGVAAGESGVSILEADEFSFVPRESVDRALDPLGDLADVQEEIKSICSVLEMEDGTKADFFALFAMIREKYPKVFAYGIRAELAEFIVEHLPFELSEDELAGLLD